METIQQILTSDETRSEYELLDTILETFAELWQINYRRDARQGYPELLQAAVKRQNVLVHDSVVRVMLGGSAKNPDVFFSKMKAPLNRRVAANNDPYARYFLAARLPLGEERQRELLRAAEDGCPYAYYQLACEAQGTEQADSIPVWLRKGAENGCPIAQYEHALLLEETDMKQATAYLEKAQKTERKAALELLRLVIEGKTQTEKQEELLRNAAALSSSGDEEATALVKQAAEHGWFPSETTDASECPAPSEEDLASATPEKLVLMLTDETRTYFRNTMEQLGTEYFGTEGKIDPADLVSRLDSLPHAQQDGRVLSVLGFCRLVGIGCRKNKKQGLADLTKAVNRYNHLPSALFVILLSLQDDPSLSVPDDIAAVCMFTAALSGHPVAQALLDQTPE